MLSLKLKSGGKKFCFLKKNNKSFTSFNGKTLTGFTLVETLIAITLVTVGLLGVISLIIYAISTVSLVKGKLIASQLAQEGIEIVRNIRDNNWLAGNIDESGWRYGLGDGTYVPVFLATPTDTWSLTPISNDINNENDKSSRSIYFNTNEKIYGQAEGGISGWELKPFERWIKLFYREGRIEVTSHIRWQEKGRIHDFEVVDYLYNWQKGAGMCPSGYAETTADSSGYSYYASIGENACTGQEMTLDKHPFRPSSQSVCVNENAFSQDYSYCSIRSSSALCETVDPCVPVLAPDSVYSVVDPL